LRGALAEEYDQAAAAYDTKWAEYTRETVAFCLEQLPTLPPGAVVLDLACGTGALLRALRSRPDAPARYVGIDNSSAMLAQAARSLGGVVSAGTESSAADGTPAVSWLRGGADEPFPLADGSVDAVVCANSFHFFGAPRTTLAEAQRVLRPGGILLIGDWSSDFLTCRLLEWFLRSTGRPTSPVLLAAQLGALVREAAPALALQPIAKRRLLMWWGFMVLCARLQAQRRASVELW
jgi:ubiquinone/menaquinone biosynthesis C-methylase UbiE